MSNNTRRIPEQVDKANPRPDNKHGHIIELVEDGGEHSVTTFRWDLLITCGDPNNQRDNASYQGHKDTSWMSCPENIAFDDAGRLWVATDGRQPLSSTMMPFTSSKSKVHNEVWPRCS
jgi:uncharacterized protein